jgi:hypothetical protein
MLERELRKKWPALLGVRIEYKVRMRKNPPDPAVVIQYAAWAPMTDAGLRLVASFPATVALRAGAAVGKETITPPAKAVGKFLRDWVEKFTEKKRKRKTQPKRTTKSRGCERRSNPKCKQR